MFNRLFEYWLCFVSFGCSLSSEGFWLWNVPLFTPLLLTRRAPKPPLPDERFSLREACGVFCPCGLLPMALTTAEFNSEFLAD